MKAMISTLLLAIGGALFMGCASLASGITGGRRPVYLINSPFDLRVSTDGKERRITREAFDANPNAGIVYYTAGVKLPFKEPMQLELYSGSRTAKVQLRPKTRVVYHVLTLFIFPIGGNIIDAVTKNDKELYPKYIDVQAAMAGAGPDEWVSQGKLKRQTKRRAKANSVYDY
jgi:hypothetical protein